MAISILSAVFLMIASCGLFPSSVPQINVFRVMHGSTWFSEGESLELGIGEELKNFAVNATIAREDGSSSSDTGGVFQVWVEGETTHRFTKRFDGELVEVINRQQGVSFEEEGTYKLFGRVVADNGSEVDSQPITVNVLAPLVADLKLETTTDVEVNSAFLGNSLKWTVNTDHEDYAKIAGFQVGFRREGREAFTDAGSSFTDDWKVFKESDSALSRSGNEYSFSVTLAGSYSDDDSVQWQSDGRRIAFRVIAVDENGEEIITINGGSTLQLFHSVRAIEAERDGDDIILRFTGSSLATHFELMVTLHSSLNQTYNFHATGNNKIALARSDFDSSQENDWRNKPLAKTSRMYEVRLNGIPRPSNLYDRNRFDVTPGKSISGPFDKGSNFALRN